MLSIEEKQLYELIISELREITKELKNLNERLGDNDES